MKKYFFFLIFALAIIQLSASTIEKGVLDLRKMDLFGNKIPLDGQWEFYWQELLTPEEIAEVVANDYYDFPELWNNGKTVNGQSLQANGFATYRLTVLMPEEYPEIGLYIKHVYSAANLWINGEIVDFGGRTGTNQELSRPEWIPCVIDPSDNNSDSLEIVLQISNFHHRKGGARESIYLGDESLLDAEFSEYLSFDMMLSGTLIMTGLFFMGLFFFGEREKSALYFSLFCLTFSYRIIGADDYAVTFLFKNINWQVFLKLEYLSLFIPPLFYALYTHALYPFRYRLNPFYVFATISGAMATVTLLFPPRIFTTMVESYLFILMIAIALAAITYWRAYLAKLAGSKYALFSSGVVLAVFLYNILIYLGLTVEVELITFFGYLGFFFFQSLILFFLFTNSLKKAKEEAEMAVEAKTDFLSTISHEIRTPLNAVVGLSHFLLEDNPRKDQQENLVSLKYSAEHLTSLINDILDYNKLESGFVEFEELDTDLREVVNSLYKAYRTKAEAKGININLEFDPDIQETVIADKTRLIQVLNNLADNAIKFTKEGTVTLRVIKLSETSGHKEVRFEVADTGIGIPVDKQKLIFERFTQASSSTTREFGGTGLGLSIIKRLLELQGVEMKLESTPGKGSKFYFDQTFRRGKPIAKASTEVDAKYYESQLQGKRVLLVEDNLMNVMVAEKFLSRWKMTLDIASNGFEAVKKAAENYYDIILMDLQMPEMDGYQAAHEIRGQKNPVPIVALTASALINIQEKVLLSGMNDYITKPFDPEELKQKLVKNIKF